MGRCDEWRGFHGIHAINFSLRLTQNTAKNLDKNLINGIKIF